MRFIDRVQMCDLCHKHYDAWYEYRQKNIDRRGGIKKQSCVEVHRLLTIFNAHISRCRVVAKSLGEELLFEQFEKHNYKTRDMQQKKEAQAFKKGHLRAV